VRSERGINKIIIIIIIIINNNNLTFTLQRGDGKKNDSELKSGKHCPTLTCS
jgi:hypothetical protein